MLKASYKLLQGDVIERLRELPENSVHCVVTSPPYWGLRNYGTAEWDGGDAECDHRRSIMPRKDRDPGLLGRGRNTVDAQDGGTKAFKESCGKCGAIRIDQQIGLEKTPAEYLAKLVVVFREVRRVLRSDGTCWVNMGDSYAGYHGNKNAEYDEASSNKNGYFENQRASTVGVANFKPKDLCGMPWRLAFALQEDGWWLRQDIIWSKPNPMPESVLDRCTKAHEYIFLLTKSARYFYDAEAIKEEVTGGAHARGDGVNPKAHGANSRMNVDRDPTHLKASNVKQNSSYSAAINELVGSRNKRSVWEIATEAFPEAHFATFPTKLVEPCILAGTSEKGCCEICGAPWTRKVENVDTGKTQKMPDGMAVGNYSHGSILAEGRRKGEGGKPVMAVKTLGWEIGCGCSPITTPCTVLDPFNGSGTTGVVALANRCNYIGIELNPDYLAMAERRLDSATAQGILL